MRIPSRPLIGAAVAALALMTASMPSLAHAQTAPLPKPSARQAAWQKLQYYAFCHFGPNTFSGREWGDGKEDPRTFNPKQFDARQWAKTFKDAGMRGIVVTAKHHDGFCLWPSKYSTHTVAQSPWKNGKGDVLKEISDACREFGLKFGVYLSPWDRNHPAYGTPEYNQIFAKTLEEVLTNYGPVFEVWFDGANGEGPNGKKQEYDWDLFISTVRKHQPNAVIFSDAGPDIRWIGNEAGFAGETNWSTLDRDRFVPGTPHYRELTSGHENGTHWLPGEVDVSIRPGWFWRESENDKVKSIDHLEKIWYESVGRNANLLLNVPPDDRGLIHENDVRALLGLRKRLDATFKKPAVPGERFDVIELKEDLRSGQRVKSFKVEARRGQRWQTIARGTTIGSARLLRIEPIRAEELRVALDAKPGPVKVTIQTYASPRIFAADLARRVERDQAVRQELIQLQREGKDLSPVIPKLNKVDRENREWLRAHVQQHGWPLNSVYGETVGQQAWLIAQHADDDVAFQRDVLRRMQRLPAHEVSKRNLAYLWDRVQVNSKRLQRYGTQWRMENGALVMSPTENVGELDARRTEVGLGPIDQYEAELKRMYSGAPDPLQETKEQRDARMAWFRDARFGMFIHWGLYSIPAGTWNGKVYPGASEWLINSAQIKPGDWLPLREQFNPVKFDAKEWVRIAKDAGMKYIVITSKHHEGFAMWPTAGDWDIGNTQFKRDPLKELAEECKKAGIRLCFYYSILDWTHPDYLPRRSWDDRPASIANYERYVANMKAQLKELITNYGPLGILWFDGEWDSTWTHELGEDLYRYVRTLQPDLIVNNRVGKGRAGMSGMDEGKGVGDYGTPEQEIPTSGIAGLDWESCMTMNNSWGYHADDHAWKSTHTLIENLVDCASKGGNYLLNVGPTSLGDIPNASVERLAGVGRWLKVNGEAVYGTQAGPFPKPLPWGKVTRKGNRLYLVRFSDETVLRLPGLQNRIVSGSALGKPAAQVQIQGAAVQVPARTGSDPDVFVIELEGEPNVIEVPLQTRADGSIDLLAEDAQIKGSARYEGGSKKAIGFWTNQSDTVSWTFQAPKAQEYEVEVELACDDGSEGATFEIRIGESVAKGTVPKTGGWDRFVRMKVGRASAITPGATKVEVRATSKPGMAVMNLRAVRLRVS